MNKKAFRHCFSACSQFKKHYKMHKHNKEWIVLPVIALGLLGASVAGIHYSGIMNNVPNVSASGHGRPLQGGGKFNPITNYDDYYKDGNKQPADFHILHTNHVQVLSGHFRTIKHYEAYNAGSRDYTAPHFWNIMGPGVTFPLNLNSASSTPEHNKEITVKWNDGASYNGQKLDVELTIPMSSVHDYTARNGQHHIDQLVPGYSEPYQSGNYIYVSHDFARGIRYSGFDEAQAHFQFYKAGTNQQYNIPDALLSFDSLNGIGTADAPDVTSSYDSYVFHDKYNNDYGNNFLTGEFTNYITNPLTPALVQDKKPGSNIYSYQSSLFRGKYINGGIQAPDRANGVGSYGYKGGQFHDVLASAMSGDRDLPRGPYFWLNSMLFPAVNSSSQDFYFGSGVGYAWWTLSSHDFGVPPKPNLHKSTTQGSKTKSDTNETNDYSDKFIKHPLPLDANKPFKYTITGQIPRNITESIQDHKKIYYHLYDNVPPQAKVTSVSSNNSIINSQLHAQDGNAPQDIKMLLENDELDKMKDQQGKTFTITINADVDKDQAQKKHKFSNGVQVEQPGLKKQYGQATDEVGQPPKIPAPFKSTSHVHLQDPTKGGLGEQYKYTITGKLPTYDSDESKAGYTLIDNVPGQDSIDGIQGTIDGKPVNDAKYVGDTAHMKVSDRKLREDSGKQYTLTIDVKDSLLQGSELSPGIHSIYNHAHYYYDGQTGITNRVRNWYQIQKQNNPKPKPTPITKSNTHYTLTHPGEEYTYFVNGKVPDRAGNDRNDINDDTGFNPNPFPSGWPDDTVENNATQHMVPYTYQEPHYDYFPPIQGFWYDDNYYPGIPGGIYQDGWDTETGQRWDGTYNYQDLHPTDYYQITDNINPQDTVQDAALYDVSNGDTDAPKLSDVPVTVQGQRVSVHLNQYQMTALSNHRVQLKIHVRADKLNKPQAGWNWIPNHAHVNEMLDGNYKGGNSNTVYNRIKGLQYHVHWYDFNYKQGHRGDYIPKHDAQHFGYNDSHKKNWESSADLNGQISSYNGTPDSKWATPVDNTHHDDYVQDDAGDGIAYHGSRIKIPLDQNFHDDDGHLFRFGYSENKKTAYPLLGYHESDDGQWYDGTDTDDSPAENEQSFFKPYQVPRISLSQKNNRFIVDTDKQENGLPFRLDLDLDSYRNILYHDIEREEPQDNPQGWNNDFDGYRLHVEVIDTNNNDVLYETPSGQGPLLTNILHKGYHAHSLYEVRNILNTASDSHHYAAGDSVPLHVQVTMEHSGDTDPEADVTPLYMTSHGYIADQHDITDGDFNWKNSSQAQHKSPERTIEYGGSQQNFPAQETGNGDFNRVQKEQIVLNQQHANTEYPHPATFTTGYGLRSDLGPVTYYGLIGDQANSDENGDDTSDSSRSIGADTADSDSWANGDNGHSHEYRKQLNSGTTMDFAYPSSFNQDTDIEHSSQLPYGSDHLSNPGGVHAANSNDRMEHAKQSWHFKQFEDADSSEPEHLPTDVDGNSLDSITRLSNGDEDTIENIDKFFDDARTSDSTRNQSHYTDENDQPDQDDAHLKKHPEYLQSGNYQTNYQFYDRKVYRNSGHSALATDKDPLAQNSDAVNHEDSGNKDDLGTDGLANESNEAISQLNGKGLNRLFTPFWLPLSTPESQNEDYNTVYEKARPSVDAPGDDDTEHDNDNRERLGGNFFNIEDNRADEAIGHMMVADNALHDGKRSDDQFKSDQLHSGESIQPVLGGHDNASHENRIGQNVSGFSSFANQWVKFKDAWRSLF